MNFLYALYFGAMGVVLPSMGSVFGVGTAELGRFFAANFGGFIPGVALSGFLSDRFGRKPVILCGIAVFLAALIAFRSAASFSLCLLAVPFIGAGSGTMLSVANALLSDLFAEQRSAVLNASQVIFGAGAAIAPYLANRALENGASWRTLSTLLAGGVALILFAFVFLRVPSLASGKPIRLSSLKPLLKDRTFLRLNLAQYCYAGAEVAFFQWITAYLVQMPQGASAKMTAVSLFWFCMTLGRMVNGSLIKRFSRILLAAGLAFLGGLAELSVFFARTPGWLLVSIALAGIFLSGVYICILSEVGDRFSQVTGTAFGALGVVSGLSIGINTWAMGVLSETPVGWTGAMLVPPTLAAGVTLCLWEVNRTEKTDGAKKTICPK